MPSPLSTENPALARYSVAFGSKPENSLYNRYLDVVPYDCNRLSPAGDGLRYVNASWMKEHSGNKSWIASQAPLPHTVHAFLSVILDAPRAPEASHETNICTIVQLTLEEENGIVKAQRYFPEQVGQAWTVAPETNISSPAIRVTVLERRTLEQINCVDTTIEIRLEGEETQVRTVRHLLYTEWPDHGVPDNAESLLGFVRYVEWVNDANQRDTDALRPVLVGCSAGIGRTGTFIAISSLLRSHSLLGESQSSKSPQRRSNGVSPLGPIGAEWESDLVVQEIDNLREQRMGMVQRIEQMELVYRVVQAGFVQGSDHGDDPDR